ncbi:penicillin-binding protein activator LpoB [Putridiphycobacter roseus]|uniref:Penicillin-binding protein activator LpoB n=1 Tax=Putridiphycobacter roseus TaxID=2219161 RepID=A0A2W1NCY9_9FLAO|nr:penicillin-binding protein activator LpoB [Putridiphycobacter roseus]PZE16963.1 penicillin-binding protein activator LpoB [Putridiphycobacter roseus]
MKKIVYSIAFLGTLAFGFQSCGHKVSRVDVNEQIDISGKWNDVDSRMTAEAMVEQVLGEVWLSNFVKEKGEKPVVIVGFVKNNSHEHIEAETFVKDIEKSFIKSQRVRLVQGGDKREELRAEKADQQTNASVSTMKKWGLEVGADFILQGSINSIVDAYKRDKVVYYQVDLELTNIQTNEIVWIGDKKIKKTVRN